MRYLCSLEGLDLLVALAEVACVSPKSLKPTPQLREIIHKLFLWGRAFQMEGNRMHKHFYLQRLTCIYVYSACSRENPSEDGTCFGRYVADSSTLEFKNFLE